ncbi:MAG: sigma factor-like helix-turn-helix DNA-binding protein [Phycisphaerales bacterium]
MPYRCEQLADLARQMRFTPPGPRLSQIDRAELLYWQTDPDAFYPIEYLIYRITGYRADAPASAAESALLPGQAVRDDLMRLVEDVSDTLDIRADSYDPPAMDLDELCRKLGVTPRSVARYRKQGLFARKLVFPPPRRGQFIAPAPGTAHPRKVLGYLPASVDRFIASRPQPRNTRKTGRLTHMDEATRHAIVTRARRIASRVSASPFRVAQHLSRKYNRSVETIRRLLVMHDEHDPRFAIFRGRHPPLHEREQRLIARAYRNHVPIRRLCQRFGRTPDAIYRAIRLHQSHQLRAMRNPFIVSPTFDLPDAEQVILGTPLEPITAESPVGTEQATFVRFNYLKFRAYCVIEALDPNRPHSAQIDQARTFLRWARRIRQRIAEAFGPMTESLARRQAGTSAPRKDSRKNDAALIQMGLRVLDEAIDTFDASRGSRFASHLSWLLQRYFAQPRAAVGPPARRVTAEIDPATARPLLDDTEWRILAAHRGLGDDTDHPRTLAEIADQLHLTRRQTFRIERRALRKLRRARIKSGARD